MLKRNLKSVLKLSMLLSCKERPFASLKFLLLSVEMVVRPEATFKRLYLSPVCLPTDPELPSFMKRRSDVERSYLNSEIWTMLSDLR